MKNKTNRVIVFAVILAMISIVGISPTAGARSSGLYDNQDSDAGCDLDFNGSARKAVKLRKPGQQYAKQNGGDPITVADFLSLVCGLESKVTKPVPAAKPMDIEKLEVTIDAFIIAMKQDPDDDFHIQIADEPNADADQIIIEVPPGDAYCDPRQNAHQLFLDDGGGSLSKHVFDSPPKVEITGYLFLDSVHGQTRFCKNNGNRGMHINGNTSHVKGLWEVHPVIALKSIS